MYIPYLSNLPAHCGFLSYDQAWIIPLCVVVCSLAMLKEQNKPIDISFARTSGGASPTRNLVLLVNFIKDIMKGSHYARLP